LNIEFWLAICGLVLVALLILLPPLWRKYDVTEEDLDQRNIRIARDRLAELKANKESGGLSQTQFDDQVAELELALNDDLELAKTTDKTQKQGRWLAYVLIAAIPVISATLYWKLGDYQAIGRSNEPSQVSQDNSAPPSPEAINKMVAALAEKMKAKPDNIEGWLMLGRSYKALEKYPKAIAALEHAYQLANDKAEVLLPYAEALALSKKNDWTGLPEQLVTKALTIEPDNPTGLWFAALAKAQQNDKKSAVALLRKLETLLPADSPDKEQIHNIIVNTEAEGESPTPSKAKDTNPVSALSITVKVSLYPELQPTVAPQDTVFVYAQALAGAKMPLAIERKQVKDLPLSISLSDADSMLPNIKLSNFKEVKLLARISKSGSALPQPGDLIGIVEQANIGINNEYSIVIKDLIK
jgi:cytochrome c-type biogenesis protein CcmH